MLRVLVTGGLGFIGSHLVDRLVSEGHDVTVVDDLSTGQIDNRNVGVKDLRVMNVIDFCRTFRYQFDVVYHLANNARIARSFEFPSETLLNNYDTTVAVLEYVRKNCPDATLFFASSSTTEFTNKLNNPYTLSKVHCDDVIALYRKHYNLRCSVVKFYNAYGSMRERDLVEYTTIIRKFKQKVLEDQPLTVYGDGSKTRDFTHINDTVEALMILFRANNLDDVYHIGTGRSHSIKEIAEAFQHPIEYLPDREYELRDTLAKPNVPGWEPRADVIAHIDLWRRNHNAVS